MCRVNTHTHTHTHKGMAGAHIAERGSQAKGTPGGLRFGRGPWAWREAWGGRWWRAGELPPVSRTSFSHGIWLFHTHPKSIGSVGLAWAEVKENEVRFMPHIWRRGLETLRAQ